MFFVRRFYIQRNMRGCIADYGASCLDDSCLSKLWATDPESICNQESQKIVWSPCILVPNHWFQLMNQEDLHNGQGEFTNGHLYIGEPLHGLITLCCLRSFMSPVWYSFTVKCCLMFPTPSFFIVCVWRCWFQIVCNRLTDGANEH